jgi:hypothetical protein
MWRRKKRPIQGRRPKTLDGQGIRRPSRLAPQLHALRVEGDRPMMPKITLLQLVDAVSELTETEAELIAVVIDLVNGGHVELGGTFRGCKFPREGTPS